MYLGDNLIRDGITEFVEEFRRLQPDAEILLAKVREPQRFGVAELEDGRVVRLVEKPPVPGVTSPWWASTSSPPRVSAIERIKPSARGELEITDAIQRMIDDGARVMPHVITGCGRTPVARGHAGGQPDHPRHPGSRVEGRSARACGSRASGHPAGSPAPPVPHPGPAIIGSGTLIEEAYVGPFTSIYHDCTIRRSEIEHSIVLEGA